MTEPNSIDQNSCQISISEILREIHRIAFESKGKGGKPFEQALERYSQELANQIIQHFKKRETQDD